MNHNSFIRGLLVAALLVAPLAVTAGHHSDNDESKSGSDKKHHRYDPVKRAQKHLDKLEQKLTLKDEQQTAWKKYSGAVLTRANERAANMKEFHGKRGEMADMDTASKLEKMALQMRERADKMQQMAQDTRTFQQALSPEQQASFDDYWKSQFRHGKKKHRNKKD